MIRRDEKEHLPQGFGNLDGRVGYRSHFNRYGTSIGT